MPTKTLFEESQGVFLDLASCGSSIRWGVHVTEHKYRPYNVDTNEKAEEEKTSHRFSCSINLTDCSRSISWSGGYTIMAKKLDTAIAALVSMRNALEAGQKIIPPAAEVEDDD